MAVVVQDTRDGQLQRDDRTVMAAGETTLPADSCLRQTQTEGRLPTAARSLPGIRTHSGPHHRSVSYHNHTTHRARQKSNPLEKLLYL